MRVPTHGLAKPDDHVIVLFGATGDLAKRKLLPGLFHLFVRGAAAHGTSGSSARRRRRSRCRPTQFRDHARDAVARVRPHASPTARRGTRSREPLSFGVADPDDAEGPRRRRRAGRARDRRARRRRLHHLAVPPVGVPLGDRDARRVAGSTRTRGSSARSPSATTSRRRKALNATIAQELRRVPGLPDRPLPRARSRSTTSSRCASRTGSSSRSGTATT